jgi:hypothetical protein
MLALRDFYEPCRIVSLLGETSQNAPIGRVIQRLRPRHDPTVSSRGLSNRNPLIGGVEIENEILS